MPDSDKKKGLLKLAKALITQWKNDPELGPSFVAKEIDSKELAEILDLLDSSDQIDFENLAKIALTATGQVQFLPLVSVADSVIDNFIKRRRSNNSEGKRFDLSWLRRLRKGEACIKTNPDPTQLPDRVVPPADPNSADIDYFLTDEFVQEVGDRTTAEGAAFVALTMWQESIQFSKSETTNRDDANLIFHANNIDNRKFGIVGKADVGGPGITAIKQLTVTIDSAEDWSDLKRLALVLAHETGHAFGLKHTRNQGDLMYGSLEGQDGLSDNDKARMKTLWNQ